MIRKPKSLQANQLLCFPSVALCSLLSASSAHSLVRSSAVGYTVISLEMSEVLLLIRSCGGCKYGYDSKPEGHKPSPGTVWCGKRSIQMAKSREMPCFVQFGGKKITHCFECKKAKITTPSGSALQLGNVWCDKKRQR